MVSTKFLMLCRGLALGTVAICQWEALQMITLW